jgi:hypothetical protein
VLRQVEAMLAAFGEREDTRRHAAALASSGVAGTETRFPFFYPTARWLVRRCGRSVRVDWKAFEEQERVRTLLPCMVTPAETIALDEYDLSLRDWIDRMRGPDESDAQVLVRRFDAMPMSGVAKERLWDEIDVPLRVLPGPPSPSRTQARFGGSPVVFQRKPLSRERPDMRRAARQKPRSVRVATPAEGRALVDLAIEAMAARTRDLDVFSYGDPRDVRLVDFGDGLQFACIGFVPERRLVLESVYGFLTLRNGVPTGYVLASGLFGSSEVAYNVFETWRGAEAASVYGRVIAMVRWLYGSDTFVVDPYQLGHGNEEGLRSGAWWFYQKLGFRARDPEVLSLMEDELARMHRDPKHRSGHATLVRLAREYVYLHLRRQRDDVISILDTGAIGLRVAARLAQRYGADRESAVREDVAEVARLLEVDPSRWSWDERAWLERWAPILMLVPDLPRWPRQERRKVADVVRAKASLRESDYVPLFDGHRRLRRAVAALCVQE